MTAPPHSMHTTISEFMRRRFTSANRNGLMFQVVYSIRAQSMEEHILASDAHRRPSGKQQVWRRTIISR